MTILRDITNAKHREVEALPMIQTLMGGAVSREQYVTYLYELREIYSVIEDLAGAAGLLDGMPGIHRYPGICQDLQELDPDYSREILDSTQEYLDYLRQLSQEPQKKHLLFAHVYVRHMGDLYGGKIMAKRVPGSGRAYEFDDRPGIIKEFNARLTMDLGEEANRAFDYFIRIFDDLWKLCNNR